MTAFFIQECFGRHSKKDFLLPKKKEQLQLSAPPASHQLQKTVSPEHEPSGTTQIWCPSKVVGKTVGPMQDNSEARYLLQSSLPGGARLCRTYITVRLLPPPNSAFWNLHRCWCPVNILHPKLCPNICSNSVQITTNVYFVSQADTLTTRFQPAQGGTQFILSPTSQVLIVHWYCQKWVISYRSREIWENDQRL